MSRNKWSSFSLMILLMLFLAGLFLVLYPSIQGAVVDRKMMWEADSFLARLEDDPDKDIPTVLVPSTEPEESRPYPELWDSMAAYNQQIYTDGQSTLSEAGVYQAALFNLTDYGLPDETFGVISIPKLDLEMGDDAQRVRYSPIATVRAFRASQAMGRAQRDAGG